jgi:hypothetical protein
VRRGPIRRTAGAALGLASALALGVGALPGAAGAQTPAGPEIEPRTGSVTSQGVARVGAPAWHAVGLRGAGVRVAVVDTNFVDWTAAQASGDLPPAGRLFTRNFCSAPLSRPFDAAASAVDRQRGTDAAEVVADMAPDAEIHLVCIDADSVADAQQAVDYAVASGIRILVSDVRFLQAWRGDGTGGAGTPDAVVADAHGRGVLWIQAAGEHGTTHYRGSYGDGNSNQLHDFAPLDDLNDVFQVAAGETVSVFLRWDPWPASTIDFDLEIYRLDNTQPVQPPVATGTTRTTGGPPVEKVTFTNTTGQTQDYAVGIRKFTSGPVTATLDLFVARRLGRTFSLRYADARGSVVDPGNSPLALTAVGWCDAPARVLDDASAGPPVGGTAPKPDLAAPARVATSQQPSNECQTGYGGTGAAAAHVAGAAALVLQRTPTLTVDQLRAAVLDRTVDVGAPGRDDQTGRGALRLGRPTDASPIATPVTATAKAGVATPIGLSAVDPNGYPLTYALLSLPAHGTVGPVGPTVTYTPDVRYRGPDDFTYQVTDPFGRTSAVATVTVTVSGAGYYIVLADGTPQAHGNVPDLPAPSGAVQPGEVPVGVAARPQGDGYWIALRSGRVVAVGGARHAGDAAALPLNRGVVGIAATATGEGYWLVAGDGGIFSFGDAAFHGSMGATPLNQPVVGMSPTPSSGGYWLVALDGGIFSFGDAAFHGSTGGLRLNQPVFSMSATRDGAGYWLVARDGGIFAFGAAEFHGSAGAEVSTSDVVSLGTSASGGGYYLARRNGQVYAFGDAPDFGSLAGSGTVIGLVVG